MYQDDVIYLRPITREDTEMVIGWRNKEEVKKWFIYQKDFTKETHEAWLRDYVDTGECVQMIVVLKEGDEPVGSVYIRDIDRTHHKGEFGAFIGSDSARGKGIGTRSCKLMLQYGFEQLNLHKIVMRAYADNLSSLKFCKNAGFVQEAYLKDDVFVRGEYRDMVLMSVIRDE